MPLYIGLLGLFDVEMGTHLRRQTPEHRVSKDPSTGPYLGARRQDGTSILQIALVPKTFNVSPMPGCLITYVQNVICRALYACPCN